MTATTSPNVRGVVLPAAVAPGCYPGEPCDPPAGAAAFLAFRRAGRPTVRARLGQHGGFALHLAPGVYTLGVVPAQPSSRIVPAAIRVPLVGTVRFTVRIHGPVAQP